MTKARDIASAIPAPSTVSSAELGYLDGVTSAIQTQVDAKTAKSTLSTTGDIYYASAANTPARLGIGSSAQVLTVASGVPSWATPASGGGMTLLSTTSLTGSSVTVSSISQSYKNLKIIIRDQYNSASDDQFFRLNGDTGGNYNYRTLNTYNTDGSGGGGTITCTTFEDSTKNAVMGQKNDSAVNRRGYAVIDFLRYTESEPKMSISTSYSSSGSTPNRAMTTVNGVYNSNTAISSFTYFPDSGTFTAGTIYIYGVS